MFRSWDPWKLISSPLQNGSPMAHYSNETSANKFYNKNKSSVPKELSRSGTILLAGFQANGRTGLESYYATSIDGVRQLIENAREWSMSLDFQEEDAE